MFSEGNSYSNGNSFSNGQGMMAGDPRNTEPAYVRWLKAIQSGAYI